MAYVINPANSRPIEVVAFAAWAHARGGRGADAA